jgi:DNA-binding CsgD family transcriptional regulator
VSSARAIEAIHAGRLEPHLPDLARHWAAAVPAGHAAEALEWAERAADAALRDLAYEEAARLYRSALAHAAASTDRASRLQLSLARALYLTGDLRGCADASFAAAELARDIGRADFLGEAALVLEAVALPELNARVYDLCVEAIDRLGDDASQDALRARLLAQLSHLSFYRREYDRLDTLSRDALDLARRTGDDTALVTALRARQEAVSGPHGISEVGELAHSMLAAGRRMRSPSVSMWGHVWYLDALWAQGRLADARVELDRLAECVARIGGPIPRWHLARCRAVVAQAQGRLAEAHAFALESYEVMKGVEPETARRGYVVALTMLGHHARLRDDEVELFLPDEPPAFVLANAMRAVGLIDAGRVEEARAKFARLGPASGWQVPPFLRVSMLVGALLAKVRLGPRDDVAHIHGVLSEYRGFNAVGGAGAYVYMGPVELYLGAAAAYLGRPDEAIADLETAIDRSTCSGTIGFTLEAMIELARVLVDRDRPRVTELAGRAADDADALGMDVLAGRARDVLGKATRTASVLSAREDEVAALVAQGKTNREIAEALFISERTAQNHVQHILTKLGFSRRSEIATWVARRPE